MTLTTSKAAAIINRVLLIDKVDVFTLGEAETTGFTTERKRERHLSDVVSLVQTTTLQNAVESITANTYSVKVPAGTDLQAGMLVVVTSCYNEPALVGKQLLVDKVSENGLAMLRKGVAQDYHIVDHQGV